MIKNYVENELNIIQFDRKNKANAFNGEMIKDIIKILKKAEKSSLKAHVFIGNENIFSSGADLNWLRDNNKSYEGLLNLYFEINKCKKMVISVIEGKCVGGGVGIASISDIVLACSSATFKLPESNHNITPGILSPFLINRIGKGKFLSLVLNDKEIGANEALSIGLVDICLDKSSFKKDIKMWLEKFSKYKLDYLLSLKKVSLIDGKFKIDLNKIKKINIKLLNE